LLVLSSDDVQNYFCHSFRGFTIIFKRRSLSKTSEKKLDKCAESNKIHGQ